MILVLGLGFMGWRNGVIKVTFTLIGGIVGLVLAGRLWSDVAEVLPIDNESVAKIAAFVLILAVVTIAAAIAARIIKTILKIAFLGWVDGLAGLAIGLLLGAIAATAVVSAAGAVAELRGTVDFVVVLSGQACSIFLSGQACSKLVKL